MLRDPKSISRIMNRANIVTPTAFDFELYNRASNSDRVSRMYARSRVRYGMHDLADFEYSRTKEFYRGW